MRERFFDNTPMTDRDALLRAICENPDDDAPRLIYADWLDEYGRSEDAEFIRVQVELVRLGFGGAQREDDDGIFRYSEPIRLLIKRQHELWSAGHGRPILPDHHQRLIPDVWKRDGSDLLVRRGFVERISTTTDKFLQMAAKLFALQPVTHVNLFDRRPSSTGRGYARCRGSHGHGQDHLPDEIWRYLVDSEVVYHVFANADRAMAALNTACVRYGRTVAGIESITNRSRSPPSANQSKR